MKQSLIENKLTRAQKQYLTVNNLAFVIMKIMQKHMGTENAISRRSLFYKIFKKREEDSLEDWLRWEFVKRAMHRCRQRTKCFIGSLNQKGIWKYFVVVDYADAEHYINILKKNIKRMEFMQQKCLTSVEEKWHSQSWEIQGKPIAKLIE